jgi:glycosyltransferase involved in cell wall biosynthesis
MNSESGAALAAQSALEALDAHPLAGAPRASEATRRASAGPRSGASGDVVFTFSYLSWSAAAQRGWFGTEDRLARGLVEHDGVRRVLICDRARSLPAKLLRERVRGERAPFPTDERRRLLAPVRLRRGDPSSLRGVARAFATYGRTIERGAREMGLERPALITTHPLVAGFADLSWAGTVTYYALDDWTEHPAYRRWWAAYRESYRRIRERGHRVAAVSEALLRRLAPNGAGGVVPNGLEPSEWEWSGKPDEDGSPAGDPGPLVVYAGTLDARLDVPWLVQTARSMPDATLALVGPVVDAAHLEPLRAERNIEIRAALPRAELAALLRAADLGVIPHRRSPLTEAMSPLKLYEYLAGGLPVVATDLEPMRGIDPRVLLVGEGGDFAGAARQALALGRARERERLEFVRANSWRSRHDALLALALA